MEFMKSCLIVDDSSVIRKVARRILENMDFIVDEAEDGQEAYEKCAREMPDVILLDWQMPIMSGLEKPRIVYCTTERDIGHMAMARKAGANDHILKPFDQSMLEAKFQAYV
jgi:two-component system chemotaxis response regulator CheY